MKKYYLKRSAMALVLIFVLLFTSCSYTLTYPDYLTVEYFYENYRPMPNGTVYLQCAENSFAEKDGEGYTERYFGIKGLDDEKFIATAAIYQDTSQGAIVWNKKESSDWTPWLDYTVTDVELFWGYGWDASFPKMIDGDITYWKESEITIVGKAKVCRKVRTFNADKFISDIYTKYEDKDYRFDVYDVKSPEKLIMREVGGKTQFLQIRFRFKEYNNIAYDAFLIYDEEHGVEIILYRRPPNRTFNESFAIKLDDKFAEPILKIINSLDK